MKRRWVLVVAGGMVWAVAEAQAAEAPAFDLDVVNTKILYTATPQSSSVPGFKPHINFPWMSKRGDGSFVTYWSVGQTHGAGRFGLGVVSSNNGETWSTPLGVFPFVPPIVQMNPPLQTSRGFEINMYSDTARTSWSQARYTSTNGGISWIGSTASFNTGSIGYISMYQNPGDVVSDGSALLIHAFGQRPGLSTFEQVLFASTDGGTTWNRRATVAAHIPGPNASMGEEGPNESDIIKLNNGKLLSVFRTGQPFPNSDIDSVHPSIFFSHSSDGGFTWTAPKMLGVMGSYPHLNKLDDGSIAMTYGRYGVKVMIADPTGTRWGEPFVIHDESTSGYVRMHRRSDGRYLLAYDHSSFYPPSWNASPPPGYVYANDQMAHMKMATLEIKPARSFDYYDWDLEYHGDVTPDTLAQPWAASLSGSPSVYLWADLGQDYIRTDTGSGGASRGAYYTLDGAAGGTSWAEMDFSAGVVSEFRARAGAAGTSEGSANIFMGDGAHGYISFELTGAGINLEGQGGNAAQVSYLASAHPGFSTLDWHDYRLVIAPDPAAGGAIRASLFLDSDKVNPILTQALNPALVDEIRFGDQTGTNNGVLDLDYLRYATQLNQWRADASGNWSSPASWTASVPGGIGSDAYLLTSIRSPRTVTVDVPVTVGHLIFDNPNRYTLAGPGTLTLQTSSGSAEITLVNGGHSITAPISFPGNAVIQGTGTLTAADITNSGSLSIQTGVRAARFSGGGTINVAAGQALEAGRIHQRGLFISGSVAISPNGTSDATSKVDLLSIAGPAAAPTGRLDLGDNDMVATQIGGGNSLAVARDLIRSGHAGGSWAGNGITSSAATTDPTMAIGYRSALSMFGAGGGTFSGIAVSGDAVLLKYTYFGDADLDGQVNVGDLGRLATGWQTSGVWDQGDFNYDGVVNVGDLGLLATNWQRGAGGPVGPSLEQALVSMGLPQIGVPEPAALGALLLAITAMQRRRTGRKE